MRIMCSNCIQDPPPKPPLCAGEVIKLTANFRALSAGDIVIAGTWQGGGKVDYLVRLRDGHVEGNLSSSSQKLQYVSEGFSCSLVP